MLLNNVYNHVHVHNQSDQYTESASYSTALVITLDDVIR